VLEQAGGGFPAVSAQLVPMGHLPVAYRAAARHIPGNPERLDLLINLLTLPAEADIVAL